MSPEEQDQRLEEFTADVRALISKHEERVGSQIGRYILALTSEWTLAAIRDGYAVERDAQSWRDLQGESSDRRAEMLALLLADDPEALARFNAAPASAVEAGGPDSEVARGKIKPRR